MPSSPGYKRNYKQEAKYHATSEQKKKRASRNAARAMMMKAGKVKKGDGKDVDHRNGNPTDNRRANLVAKSRSANRSFSRNANAGKKGS